MTMGINTEAGRKGRFFEKKLSSTTSGVHSCCCKKRWRNQAGERCAAGTALSSPKECTGKLSGSKTGLLTMTINFIVGLNIFDLYGNEHLPPVCRPFTNKKRMPEHPFSIRQDQILLCFCCNNFTCWQFLFDTSRFTRALTQIVQFCTTYITATFHFD